MNIEIKRNALSFGGEEIKNKISPANKHSHFPSLIFGVLLLGFIFTSGFATCYSQTIYQPNYFTGNQPNNNYMANSSAFRQEIARVEINVAREGRTPLPITQVPRLEKNDVLKVRLVDEQVNGMKPDQSNWDWTFLVAFINPGRNNERERLVSEEIQFRKSGWYKEYSFTVPYDSQPIFFLYTKPKYRDKILNLINKNQEEIRKIGEKTIELSGAYAKIGSFLNELQYVINRYQYSGSFGNYGTYGTTYNPYGTYNYGTTGTTPTNGLTSTGFNQSLFMEQAIERLARSFNIQLPGCWQNGSSGYGNYGYNNGTYGTYNNYGTNNAYGTNNYGYNNYGYNNYGSNSYGGLANDFIGRAQCVAKSVRLEDFDISVSRMLQQGGILAAAQLSQKYPQIAFWINVAAAALDFILKVTRKTPLRLVPTVISTTDNPSQVYGYQQNYANQQPSNYQTNYQANTFVSPNISTPATPTPGSVKISLFAESPPSESDFVTAYPLVIHKWQANPDPEVMTLPVPALADQCLHAGQNILRSTDLLTDWMSDTFTKDFKLVVSSSNGFRKEFPLKKNVGMSGWELNITKEDLNAFPKINMTLESEIVGKRGFNEIRSPKFNLPIPVNSTWELDSEAQKEFTVGGKRRVTLRNQLGNCRCLQTVVYKPSFGGQFVYDVNSKENNLMFSDDGQEVSFIVNATNFQPGAGQLELKQYGGEVSTLSVTLYPLPPNVTDLKVAKGDNRAIVVGERLEQLRAVKINGKRAIPADGNIASTVTSVPNQGNNVSSSGNAANTQATYPNASQASVTYPNQAQGNTSAGSQYNYPTTNQNTYQGNTSNNQYNYPNVNPGGNTNASINNPSTYPNNSPENNSINNSGMNSAALSERVFVFEDSNARQDSNTISLELEVDANRIYKYPRIFNVSLARPTILANEAKEVEGVAIGNKTKMPVALSRLPVFLIDTAEISVNVQNALTDYDFKVENIQVETRIENSQVNPGELPRVNFEVLDWKNMQINFLLSEQFQKLLGGRRLQFRIRDRVRGDSDWYTLRNTFVRTPEIKTVRCTKEMNGNCEMKGVGIEYISQVSIDGGKTWYPQEPATLTVQSTPDGQKAAMIPRFSDRKRLQIRLRDFKTNEGLIPNDFSLLNAIGR